jgi:hypothetical protein
MAVMAIEVLPEDDPNLLGEVVTRAVRGAVEDRQGFVSLKGVYSVPIQALYESQAKDTRPHDLRAEDLKVFGE